MGIEKLVKILDHYSEITPTRTKIYTFNIGFCSIFYPIMKSFIKPDYDVSDFLTVAALPVMCCADIFMTEGMYKLFKSDVKNYGLEGAARLGWSDKKMWELYLREEEV